METGRASKTALRVAQRRAVHQVLDQPCVLTDPIAIPLLSYDAVREMHPFARAFRAFMAARSRYAEDRLAASVAQGVTQYVILGAGLDTFAYRNPFPQLRVFEVTSPPHRSGSARCFPRPPLPRLRISPSCRSTSST